MLRLKKEQEFIDQTEEITHGKGNETKELTGDNAVGAETEETGVTVGRGNGDGRGKGAEAETGIEGDIAEKETRINLGVEAGKDAEIGVEAGSGIDMIETSISHLAN